MTLDHGRLKGKIIQISFACPFLAKLAFLFNFALTKTLYLPLILQLPLCSEVWFVFCARTVLVAENSHHLWSIN